MEDKILIGFEDGSAWYSPIIKWINGDKFNHIFLVYHSDIWKTWVAVDIQPGGVVTTRLSKVLKRKEDGSKFKFFECPEEMLNGFKLSKKFLDASYDYLGLFYAAIKVLFNKWFGWYDNSTLQDRNKVFCSELVAIILKNADIPGSESFIPSLTSPKHLLDFVENSTIFNEVACFTD